MKKLLLLKSLLLLCALVVGTSSSWAEPITLFHESFGDNSGSARDWSDSYSVKSGVASVYSGITGYTVSNVKQGKNTTGSTKSGLNQSSQGTDAYIIIGPLNVASYSSLALTYQWKAASIKGTYSTSLYYKTSAGGDFAEVNGTGAGATGFVERSYSLPAAAQVSTLYLKIVWNTSNTQAIIDEVDLAGTESGGGGSSTYTVTYNGNGNTGGTVPTDATEYASGATVTVLGNTGSLVKTGHTFSGWNTEPDGNGTDYSAGASFSIAANTTLYAKWTDNRTSAGLAWSAASASVKYGAGDNVFPTLTNTHGVDVTYTSTDHSAATIDENGIITLKNITKSTTISAIFAGNDDYLPQTETYTLNVNYGIEDGIFDFVNAGNASPLEHFGSGVNLETNSSNYITEEKTWTAGNVTMVTSGKYRWWYNGCELKLYNITPRSAATFSVPDGYVITKIVTTGGNFTTITSGGGNLSGNTWTGASQSVKLSIGTSTVSFKTITVTYTTPKQTITPSYDKITYVTPYMMNFSNIVGLKAYVATSANASGVTMTSVEGAVPENTPLLLIGTANDSYEVPVAASATAPATNLLKKGDGTTVFNGSTFDYILYSDGKFYQIGSGTVATNKAYLHLDAAPSGARSLDIVFDDNETTGVNEVKTQKATGEYFNLAGQRVAQPTKGLYIVNGKKYVIK